MYNKIRDPAQVKAMGFRELKYWVLWNEAIDDGLEQAYGDRIG